MKKGDSKIQADGTSNVYQANLDIIYLFCKDWNMETTGGASLKTAHCFVMASRLDFPMHNEYNSYVNAFHNDMQKKKCF